jgi:hypothetical protein
MQYPFVYYAAVLLWCSNLLRKNPSLTDYFSAFIKPHTSDSRLRKQLLDYDALAVECFLLGVVDLAPNGQL